MAGPSFAAYGVMLLVFRGLLHTVQLSVGCTLKSWEWPYFRLMSMVCLLASVPIAAFLAVTKVPMPEPEHRKFVLLRGLFGAGGFVCSVLAAQLGAPVGDVEALRSINMVAAALLGRLMLGEELRPVTAVALSFSAAGAVLISQPGCLFGRHGASASSTAWIGDLLALTSGICQACVFVCSRKAPGTSVWVQALSSHLMSSLAAGALPATGAVEDYSLAPLLSTPWQAAAWFAALFVNTFVSTMTLSAAAQWCSAAESAIVSTSAGMGFGFVAQTEVFGEAPNKLALGGAALMLSGVVLMALSQSSPPAKDAHKALPSVPEEEQLESGGLPLLSLDTAKPIDPGMLPGASDASTCDYDLRDLEDLVVDEQD